MCGMWSAFPSMGIDPRRSKESIWRSSQSIPMRTISVIGARIDAADLTSKGWYNVIEDRLCLPHGIDLYEQEDGTFVIGYTIYDSKKDITDNSELSVETLFDLIDEFAHETNITQVKYITIQVEENAI